MWFAIVGKRTLHGTTARTRSPAENPEPRSRSAWSSLEAVRLDELGARARVVVELDPARIGHLASAGRVERRFAQLREEEAVAEILERAELRQDVRLRVADELGREVGATSEVGGALELRRSRRRARPRDAAPSPRGSRRRRPPARAPRASSTVSSSGKPYVAASVNACSPEIDSPVCELVEQLEPALERLPEALLLEPQDALDLVA